MRFPSKLFLLSWSFPLAIAAWGHPEALAQTLGSERAAPALEIQAAPPGARAYGTGSCSFQTPTAGAAGDLFRDAGLTRAASSGWGAVYRSPSGAFHRTSHLPISRTIQGIAAFSARRAPAGTLAPMNSAFAVMTAAREPGLVAALSRLGGHIAARSGSLFDSSRIRASGLQFSLAEPTSAPAGSGEGTPGPRPSRTPALDQLKAYAAPRVKAVIVANFLSGLGGHADRQRLKDEARRRRLAINIERLGFDWFPVTSRFRITVEGAEKSVEDFSRRIDRVVEKKLSPVLQARPAALPKLHMVPSYEGGLVAALSAPSQALAASIDGSGDAEFWAHHHHVRSGTAHAAADAIEKLDAGSDPKLRGTLNALTKDLREEYPPAGDLYFWLDKIRRQDDLLDQLKDRIEKLPEGLPAPPEGGDTAAYESGLAQGLRVAAAALASTTVGYGDLDYWVHHFALRITIAEALSAGLWRLAGTVREPALRESIEIVAKALLRSESAISFDYFDFWDPRVKIYADRVRLQDAYFKTAGAALGEIADLFGRKS